MALTYKTRKRLSLLVLTIGLPLYIMVAVSLVALLPPMPVLVELLVYTVLGIAWVFPLKAVFIGVGKADPDAPGED
ncbi:DUF2842 domain-containing protein [Jannaschia sp. M317]|uniref:DUF2842 domain-containing protein n=1 Tax=Jannaschia sp. M317 TaxID=2867011 RepID=UPI0021A81778|nr:DUF2842 domain-containing protein [Jannaschia sp. M317]UWQ18662.1 DUF2842 domain-containing protein [Jannaschia sp. M317]